MPYIVYFLGPLALAFVVRRSLGTGWPTLGAGFLTFLLAWVAVMVVTQVPASLSPRCAEGTVLYTVLVAGAAGLFEESGRYVAFRTFRALRAAPTWRTGMMYAVGHSGMESFIVGGSLLLTAAVVAHASDALSPELLAASEQLRQTGTLGAFFGATERLLVGLLIHAAFTLVVVLAIVRSDRRYLVLAIGWHIAHDLIAQNLHRVSEHWMAHGAWIAFIVVVYSWISWRLIQTDGRSHQVRAAPAAAGPAA